MKQPICIGLLGLVMMGSALQGEAPKEKPLTNEDVIALVEVDLGDEVVLAKVNQAKEVAFDTSTEGLIALRRANVSNPVIQAMLSRQAGPRESDMPTHPPQAAPPAAVPESSAPAASPQGTTADQPNRSGFRGRLRSAFHRETPEEEAAEDAADRASHLGTDADRDCGRNYTREGSFFGGYQYKDWIEISGLAKDQVFDRLFQAISVGGYQIVNSNKDAGVISANQGVSFGEGKTAPINITARDTANGVRIDAVLSTSGGVVASQSGAVKEFCRIFDAAAAP